MRSAIPAVAIALLVAHVPPASAYSVLAHESNIDALWDGGIKPLLVRKFPKATAEDLREARAYSYGGSVIQDLGYYPFGNHFFTNLVHYVRSGDFVAALIRDARSLNEYAFALGALSHYASDNTGHPEAVNRAVPLMFPELMAKYGNNVTYVKSPATHVLVEFSFDVVQAASGSYVSDAFHDFVGFKVEKSLLERAFRETYGLEMAAVFRGREDLAIGTYRHAVSEWLPRLTETAWRQKHEEIERLNPGMAQGRYVFRLSRRDYEREFGREYKRPGFIARTIAVVYRLVPKIGPLRPLRFEAPNQESEALFKASLKDSRAMFRQLLAEVRRDHLELPNTDFDTGHPSAHGEYELADETYAELLNRLASDQFANIPPALRRNILAYYEAAPNRVSSKHERKRLGRIRQELTLLSATMR
jgi:hypothetical protein